MSRTLTARARAAAVLGIAALAAGPLAGCTADGGGDAETITITSNMTTGDATGDYLMKVTQAYTDETGVVIDVQETPNDEVADVFETASVAGEQTDLVILNLTPDSSDWYPNGLVVGVDDYLDDWGLRDTFQQGALDYWNQNGGINGFPLQGFNWPVWYNMDLLGQVGWDAPPATFDELVELSAALRAAGIQPFAMGGNSWPVQNFITWLGQQYLDADAAEAVFTEGAWCDADALKGLELFQQMRDDGVFIDQAEGYDDSQMNTAYFNGDAAMAPLGSWNYTGAFDQAPDVAEATVLAGFPTVDGGSYDKPTAYNGHGTGIWISTKGAEKIDAVQDFITYMYSQPVLAGWVSEANQILSVTPEAIGDATSDSPLVLAGNADVTEDTVDFMLLPDSFIPAGVEYTPLGSEFLATDESAQDLCGKLEQLYADNAG